MCIDFPCYLLSFVVYSNVAESSEKAGFLSSLVILNAAVKPEPINCDSNWLCVLAEPYFVAPTPSSLLINNFVLSAVVAAKPGVKTKALDDALPAEPVIVGVAVKVWVVVPIINVSPTVSPEVLVIVKLSTAILVADAE